MIGVDFWVENGVDVKLSKVVMISHCREGIYNLNQGTYQVISSIWQQDWKKAKQIGPKVHEKRQWEALIDKLKQICMQMMNFFSPKPLCYVLHSKTRIQRNVFIKQTKRTSMVVENVIEIKSPLKA